MGQRARRVDGRRGGVRLSVPRVLAGLTMLVVACTSSPSTLTPTASVPGPSSNGDARRVTVLAPADPPHLDVHQDVSSVLASLGPGLAYSRLLRLKTGPDVELPSLQFECELCRGWEMTDPVTYRFRLRDDVRWQEVEPVDGRPLVAQDLVFSYRRQETEGWPNAALFQAVDRVEALDDHTLQITLRYPDADFPLALADGHSKIVAREAVEVHGDLRQGPVIGSGPWTWVSTERGAGTLLQRNLGYFEEGLPRLDELRITVVRDEETRYAVFATRTADVYLVTTEFRRKLQEEVSSANLAISPHGGAGLLLAMNVAEEPFIQRSVRKAVFEALDPWDDLDSVWYGQGYVGLGLPVVRPDWLLPESETRGYFADPEQSRALLASSGVPSPLPFELTVADYGEGYLRQANSVQGALREVGFEPKVRLVNPKEYALETWPERDYRMLLAPLPPASTPNGYLFSVLHSHGRWNVSGHSDEVLDGMIEAQAVEADVNRRGELVRQLQRYLLEQAYLFMPVTEVSVWAAWPRVEGFHPNDALAEYSFWAKVTVQD